MPKFNGLAMVLLVDVRVAASLKYSSIRLSHVLNPEGTEATDCDMQQRTFPEWCSLGHRSAFREETNLVMNYLCYITPMIGYS